MSGIAGIWNLDGRPLERELLGAVTHAAAGRGPDGIALWHGGHIGLGYLALHTTPEAVHEKQPLGGADGGLRLVFDGRVDNREELAAELRSRGSEPRLEEGVITDAELVLAAYRCWGTQSPARILGDFAYALWDEREQQLFCARDVLGIRPFYYFCDGKTLIFGSELRQVLAHRAVPRRPNEGMIAEYLLSAITSMEETLWEGVLRLTPAHCMLVRSGALRRQRYWDVNPKAQIRYRNHEEYAQHCLHLLKAAVRCRLRSDRPVGMELSGGLDSCSVAAAVHLLRREAPAETAGFETFSRIYPGLECDESERIRIAASALDLPSHLVVPRHPPRTYYEERAAATLDFPGYPLTALFCDTAAQVRLRGKRVLLTGEGGNHWLEGHSYHLADMALRLQWPELLRQARHDRQFASSWWGLARQSILKPLAPAFIRHLHRRLRSKPAVWLDPGFIQRTHLLDRLSDPGSVPDFPTFAQRGIYQWAMRDVITLETYDHTSAIHGLETRHPLHDRRILEFGLALPERQRWFRQYTRPVLRHATRGVLPDAIRLCTTRPHFDILFVQALQQVGGEGMPALAARGWVVPEAVEAMRQEMLRTVHNSNRNYWRYSWPLWMMTAMEIWMQSSSQSTPSPDRMIPA